MTPEERFDDLARKKLEERSFPFEERHWLEAQKAMHAKGSNGRYRYGALLLLLLLFFTWWVWPGQEDATIADKPEGTAPVETTSAAITAQADPPPSQRSGEQHEATTQTHAGATPIRHDASAAHSDAAPDTAPKAVIAAVGTSEPDDAPEVKTKRAPFGTPSLQASTTPDPVSVDRDTPDQTTTVQAAPIAETAVAPVAPIVGDDIAEEVATVQAHPERPEPTASPDNAAPKSDAAPMAQSDVGDTETADETTETATVQPAPETDETDTAAEATNTAIIQPAEATDETDQQTERSHTAEVLPAPVDTASEAQLDTEPDAITQDTDSAQTPQEDFDPTALAPTDPSWEIGVMGGMQWSRTRHTGGNTADWGLTSESLGSATFGAEVMRMGRNFGIGLGLHHASHAERLRSDARMQDITDINSFWYLVPVDTVIFFVTDTMEFGGELHYVGNSTEVTVPVIAPGMDTTTTTEVAREARTVVNRVSYFEVPLLFDAHVVQGRWQLGVRGGPSAGLLSGRRGALPNAENNGYTDFSDQAFREVVFGWTARAYVRHRFNAGWSVGLEPMMRGQFSNSFAGEALSRRSQAWGCLLSLNYRLR